MQTMQTMQTLQTMQTMQNMQNMQNMYNKSIFLQILESPTPSLTAAALRMIICKRTAPHFDSHEKGMKNAFLRPFTMR